MIELRCPACRSAVSKSAESGWACTACDRRYPIVDGVSRFVERDAYAESFGIQWNRFSQAQLDSANGTHRSRDTFVEKTGWTLDQLKGRRVLDAGCGMGRFAEVCADAGAEVHGIDLSRAVDAAARNIGGRPNVSLYQADIMNLPFADGTFDYVYSIGVLHHTPNTRQAFESLVPLVKPGGEIAIWVYSVSTRKMLGALVFRLVTPRLPASVLLPMCRVAIPLVHIHRMPVVGHLTRVLLPTSMDPFPEWRWLDTFDWYAPTYQWKHTDPEVAAWFRDAGLTDLVHGPVEVSVRGRKPAAQE